MISLASGAYYAILHESMSSDLPQAAHRNRFTLHLLLLSPDQVTHRREGTTRESRVFFIDSTRRVNQQLLESTVPSVNFRGLMDPSPFQISDQTPMETVVEMFRKMGLRQVLVSHNG